ncbi:MAG: response regulator, partial [Planctomycetes bacterium]|nr:response regulator [Planctomycetota bacterium]
MRVREKILCVDDDLINRATLAELLGDDYDIELAVDGPDALQRARRFRPDLILLDIMMPGMNGYTVARRVRATPALRHTKIIMVSAKAMVAERLEGYDAGADDYLTKPFDHDELLAKIQVHLRLRASEEVEELHASVMASLGSRTSKPLSGILGPLELLLSCDDFEVEERTEMIRSAYDSARDLHELFGHVLRLTSLKSRQLEFEFAEIGIADFLRVVTMEYAGHPLRLCLDVDDDLQTRIDHDEMTAVLRVLIESALSRNPDGEEVEVRVIQDSDRVGIELRDRGAPLEDQAVEALFDEGSVSYDNTLGLRRAAAQHIVWGHGG